MDSKKIASPLLRILAYLIDTTIYLLPALFVINQISISKDLVTLLNRIPLLFVLATAQVIFAFLYSWMISSLGGTPGKLLTGTAIVNEEGINLSFWRSFFRNQIGYKISGIVLWLGFIWIFIDKERRAWHDQIVGSWVVIKNKWIVVLGILFLVAIIFLSVSLVSTSISNFKVNASVYSDLFKSISS